MSTVLHDKQVLRVVLNSICLGTLASGVFVNRKWCCYCVFVSLSVSVEE